MAAALMREGNVANVVCHRSVPFIGMVFLMEASTKCLSDFNFYVFRMRKVKSVFKKM
jgi:hypothetical protein